MDKHIHVALIGNPNVGKTSLFNVITGSRQHVGNWPGVTVEKKTGIREYGGYVIEVTDLPGTYSLCARSPDEEVAVDFVLSGEPEMVIQVVDATNLERNLFLTTQLLDMGLKVIIALNMSDKATERGDRFDTELFEKMWNVPVVRTAATLKEGISDLLQKTVEFHNTPPMTVPVVDYGPEMEAKVHDITDLITANSNVELQGVRWYALNILEGGAQIENIASWATLKNDVQSYVKDVDVDDIEMSVVDKRYESISKVLGSTYERGAEKKSFSDMLDRVVTDKYLGIPIFLVIMWGVFQYDSSQLLPPSRN